MIISSDQTIFPAGTFRVLVSADRLTATLHSECAGRVMLASVVAKLTDMGLFEIDVDAITTALEKRKTVEITTVVARGVASVDERMARLAFDVPVADAEEGVACPVSEGQALGRAGEPTPGKAGRDVFGEALLPKVAPEWEAGPGVRLQDGVFIAEMAGQLRADGGQVSVFPLLGLQGEEDLPREPLRFDGDISVVGGVRDGSVIDTTGCLLVGGAIEAASFNVADWAHVRGGVIGRGKGVGNVGGELRCKFAMGAKLTAGGDVLVRNEVLSSRVATAGKLTVKAGPISGGHVTANGGIDCFTLGNPSGGETIVEAGVDQALRALLQEARPVMEANRRRVAEINEKILPVLKQQRNLTPEQKIKVSELLCEAEALKKATEARASELGGLVRKAHEKSVPEIRVSDTVFPGVVIRFPGLEAVIDTKFRGPLKIAPKKLGGGMYVVIETPDGKLKSLATTVLPDHLGLFGEKPRAGAKAA